MESALLDEKEAKETLIEKNGELTRELSRTKEALVEKDLTIDDLKAESSKLESEINSLKIDSSTVNHTNELLRKECADLQMKSDADRKEYDSALKKAAAENDKRVADLRLENEALSSRLTADNATAASLDEYKKRAQAALKKVSPLSLPLSLLSSSSNHVKANAEKAVATSEVEKLQRQLEDTSTRLVAAEAMVDELKSDIHSMKEVNNTLVAKTSESEMLISSLSEEKRSFEQVYNDTVAEMEYAKQEVLYLTSELEALKSKGIPVTPKRSSSRANKGTINTNNTNESEGDSMVSDDFIVLNLTPLSEAQTSKSRRGQESNANNDRGDGDASIRTLTYDEKRSNVDSINGSAVESPVPGIPATQETPGELIEIDHGVSFKLKPSTSGDLYYVNQLNTQIDELRHTLSLKGMEMEISHNDLLVAKEEKRKLEARIEELLAYLDRTKKLQEGDSAVNMEYLKNCIYRFMSTNEVSEKKRLFPVIATILKLTSSEKNAIEVALAVEENPPEVATIKNIAESWGLWGK